MVDLIQIRTMVERCWSYETSYCDDPVVWQDHEYNYGDLAYQQCATTTDLLHYIYNGAGVYMRGMVNGQPHYWYRICVQELDNELYHYFNIDLTWRQFPAGTDITDIQQISREEMVANPWMEQRCKNMREAFDAVSNQRMAEIIVDKLNDMLP